MTPENPLDNLGPSLAAESAAVEQRFDDADRFATPPTPAKNAIRASFSFPPGDHSLLAELQARALAASFHATKSELVRAGLHALAALPPEALREAVGTLQKYHPARSRWTTPPSSSTRS